MQLRSINDVIRWRLCVGCGACAYVSNGKIAMIDDSLNGLRPVMISLCDQSILDKCSAVCPIVESFLHHQSVDFQSCDMSHGGIGRFIEIWEGYATDPEIRYLGASGGVLTALSVYSLDKCGIHGVLHVGQDRNNPIKNTIHLSNTKRELIDNAGSRYSPASVCEALYKVDRAPKPCVFIGQPSEVYALKKILNIKPELKSKISCALSFFCAGSPSSKGIVDLLESKNVNISNVSSIRYRGCGWPGMLTVRTNQDIEPVLEMGYNESWHHMQSYRPWSVHLWPDCTGEFSDVSCADAWYKDVITDDKGYSILVVRTEAGRELVNQAASDGYINLRKISLAEVMIAQRNLVVKRGSVWGRIQCLRMLGIPMPEYINYDLYNSWNDLPFYKKCECVIGTLRRVMSHGYYKPMKVGLSMPSKSN